MAVAAPADTPTILVYGDSLSAAYGIPKEQGWVALMQHRLNKEGYSYHVANASISGETTGGGLVRFSATLDETRPALVILELGPNDGLRGLPITDMKRNLAAMIIAAQKKNAKVLLIGMRIPPNYGPVYTRDFANVYYQLSKEHKLPVVPFLLDGVAGHRGLIQDDGLHPTAAAQEKLLENVWKVLEGMLVKPR
ncbi:MAG: arylesterase [Methylobacillus sp.]|jgi:acyl-CoA thioesterase-1|nr:arylesterase [Methylobacillus sp.]